MLVCTTWVWNGERACGSGRAAEVNTYLAFMNWHYSSVSTRDVVSREETSMQCVCVFFTSTPCSRKIKCPCLRLNWTTSAQKPPNISLFVFMQTECFLCCCFFKQYSTHYKQKLTKWLTHTLISILESPNLGSLLYTSGLKVKLHLHFSSSAAIISILVSVDFIYSFEAFNFQEKKSRKSTAALAFMGRKV